MNTPGSKARAAGLALLLISISAGINMGACLVAVGVRMAGDPPVVPPVFVGGPRAVATFQRRHLAVVGLVTASCAVTAVSGEAGPVLCLAMLALLVLGLSLINTGVTGE